MARCGHRLGTEALLRDHMSLRSAVRRRPRSADIGRSARSDSPSFCCWRALLLCPLAAKTLRFASGFDPQSIDPHALALQYQTRVVSQIYESLVSSRSQLRCSSPRSRFRGKPSTPRRWRFKLRPDGANSMTVTAVHRRRRRVLDPARAGQEFPTRFPDCEASSAPQGRRSDDRRHPRVARCVLPEKFQSRRHDEQGVVAAARWRRTAELQRQAGDLRGPQRQRHGTVSTSRATSPTSARCWSPIRTGGASAATSMRRSTWSSNRTPRAWPRSISGEVDFVIDPPFQDVARLKQEARFKLAQALTTSERSTSASIRAATSCSSAT